MIPPQPGEGVYLCKKCHHSFSPDKNNPFVKLLGVGIQCPQCKSFLVIRHPGIQY